MKVNQEMQGENIINTTLQRRINFASTTYLDMLFMIIERFHPGKVKDLYKRFEEKGRLMPEGLNYINSWINEDVTTCYQVMETNDKSKLFEWINHWSDLSDFEIIPVLTSMEAKEKVFAD